MQLKLQSYCESSTTLWPSDLQNMTDEVHGVCICVCVCILGVSGLDQMQ